MESKKNNSDKEEKLPTASSLTPQEKSVSSAPAPKIEGYHIISMLGEGGFGVVYLAQQERPVKRRVALKVIKPGMDSKQVIARFEAEEQALALLDHPNIAAVYEAGMAESGQPYFAMEYVKGVRITEHCDRNKLSIEERLKLFGQVCDAIGHAHQKGIIHRDIKPSNILVSIDGDNVVPKVIDFGVAKAISQPLTERTLFTEQGQLIGTPEYMSPEQAEMAGQDIDTRSDIYSLGVVLYELLAGVLPFDPKTLREAAFAEIQRIIREQDPPRPSTRLTSLGDEAEKVAKSRRTAVAALSKRLHKELEWIPLKAMRKERTHRYRSASEFADDIQNYLDGAPLIAGPESAAYRVKKFVRRHRASVTTVAGVAAALVVGLVVSTAMYFQAETLREKAEQARRIAEVARKADARQQQGRYDEAEALFVEVLEGQRRVLGEEHPDTLGSMNNLALVYYEQRRYDEAELLFEEVLEIAPNVLNEEHPETVGCMNNLALVYLKQGRYDEAEPLLTKAQEIRCRVLGNDAQDTLHSMGFLALVYYLQGRYDKAEPLYLAMLEIQRQKFGEEYEENILTHHVMRGLIGLYEAWDKPLQADEWRQMIELHTPSRMVFKNIGLCKTWDTASNAAPVLLKKFDRIRQALGEEHPDTLRSMRNLASIYLNQERYDEAEPLLEKALEIGRRVLGEEHPDTLGLMRDLASVYTERLGHLWDESRYNEAASLLEKTLEMRRHVFGEEHPDTLDLMTGLALLRATSPVAELRNGAKAVEDATKACELTNWKKPLYVGTLAAAYAEVGDFDSAVKWQRQAIDLLTEEEEETRADFEERLKLYESGQPYRESP